MFFDIFVCDTFYNHSFMPLYPGERSMSAKWRRNKRRSKWCRVARSANRAKDIPDFKSSTGKSLVRRKPYPYKYRVPKYERKRMREPEPLVDVLEEDDRIRVVAELVGFNKNNLKVYVKKQKLILSAEDSDRKYYKSLNLPKRVIPKALRTTYKNGVLEILLKKAVEEKAINKIVG